MTITPREGMNQFETSCLVFMWDWSHRLVFPLILFQISDDTTSTIIISYFWVELCIRKRRCNSLLWTRLAHTNFPNSLITLLGKMTALVRAVFQTGSMSAPFTLYPCLPMVSYILKWYLTLDSYILNWSRSNIWIEKLSQALHVF
jgi:hypothetical protein